MTHVAQQRRTALSVGHNLVRESPDFTPGWEQIHFPKCDGFWIAHAGQISQTK